MDMKKKILYIFLIALFAVLILAVGYFIYSINKDEPPIYEKAYSFSNMRGYDGKVYKGINGAYGEDISVDSSIFTIRDDKIYYADQIKQDYVVNLEENTAIFCADLNGENPELLVSDAYNLGFGQERLIGDKLFYPIGYDEDYYLQYGVKDLISKESQTIESNRINTILGYDGNYVYYAGYNPKKNTNIVGKYHLKKNKDKTVLTYPDADEVGGISNLYFYEGKIYAQTLTEEAKNYDARTACYKMKVYNADNGKQIEELPMDFTGSANYGFLFDGDMIYYSAANEILCFSLKDLEVRVLANLKEKEYWGIPHFAPGDAYLYYEAIADIDEESGLNDYFYRVPIRGGEPQLLAAWFTP